MTPSSRVSQLTALRVREVLHYDPDTGVFTWRKAPGKNRQLLGRPAGTHDHRGYLKLTIDRIQCWGHRVAWLYMTGTWPEHEIDHRDLNPSNNQWANLRPATRSQNAANKSTPRTNTSGVKGVFLAKDGRWVAAVMVHKRYKYLGKFDTRSAAANAYASAATDYFGEFARTL